MFNDPMVSSLRVNDQSVRPLQPIDMKAIVEQYRTLPKGKPGLVDWMVGQGFVAVNPLPKVDKKKLIKEKD